MSHAMMVDAGVSWIGIALVREGKIEFKTFWTLVIDAPI